MNLKKGDNVIVITGKDKGQKGKILRSLVTDNKVIIEGVNLKQRRRRPRRRGEKGQVIEIPAPINASNVQYFCGSCGRGVRLKAKLLADKKVRVCAKCGKEVK